MTPFLNPEAELTRVKQERLLPLWNEWKSSHEREESLQTSEEWFLARAFPYARAVAWFQVMASLDPLPYHHALVRRSLAREENPNPPSSLVASLAYALIKALREMRQASGLDYLTADQILSPSEEDGMMWLLAKCARYLEKRPGGGPGSRFWAHWLRKEGQSRWERLSGLPPQERLLSDLWFAFATEELTQEGLPPVGLFSVVAHALVRDQKEEADQPKGSLGQISPKRQEPVATLAVPVARELGGFFASGELKLSEDKTQVLRDGEILANVATLNKKYFEQVSAGLAHWGQLTFRRAVNFTVRHCWERYLAGEARPDIMEFAGPKHFAELIGEASHHGTDDIEKILLLGQTFTRSWPGGYIGGLWTFSYLRPARGRPAWLQIKLASVLEPHYGMGVLDTPFRVPVLELPPFVGRRNDHAAQAAFFDRLLLELVEKRVEVVREGGVLLPLQTLQRFAQEAGMETRPQDLLKKWENPKDGRARYLERNGDRLFLADASPTRGARAFILEAGRRTLLAKEAAKKGIQKKQKQIQGKGTKGPRRRKKPS